MKLAIFLVIAACFALTQADNFAVIVAGSKGFSNYRHQADACHAYQVLISKGIPAQNIVLMAYDDIAHNFRNKFKGQIFNKPADQGVDVYNGCVIDYSKGDVTPANFMAILKGDKSAVKGGNGRVLESGANDKVFINFADHGAPGLIAFPRGELHADDLMKTFDYMTENKKFSELTFYLEACESGSMFGSMKNNTKIYAVSAASPDESSWGTYCSPDDKVNGKHIGSCLGDLFSVNWMEDSDAADTKSETLQQQYTKVQNLTDKSHVMQWGDLSFTAEPIGNFIGQGKSSYGFLNKVMENLRNEGRSSVASVDSRDIYLQYLINLFKEDPSFENYRDLQAEINSIKFFTDKFTTFSERFGLNGNVAATTDFDCYREVIQKFRDGCGEFNEYAFKFFKYMYQVCENHGEIGMEHIVGEIEDICSTQTM